MLPALLVILMNATTYLWPPVVRQPILQAFQLPLQPRLTPLTLTPPPCSVNPQGLGEGGLWSNTLLCRDLPDGSTTNQTFPLTQVTWDSSVWTKKSIASSLPLPPQMGSANLKSVTSPSGEDWFLLNYPTSSPASGGTAGNGETVWLVYLEPVSNTPTILYNGTGPYQLVDIQLTRQGLFILSRFSPPPPPGGIYSILEYGILWWPPDRIPRRQLQPTDFTWLPGTRSIRPLLAFGAPSDPVRGLYVFPSLAPPVVEAWSSDPSTGVWNSTARFPVSYTGSPLQIYPDTAQTPLVLLTTKVILQVTPGPQVIASIPGGSTLSYRALQVGGIATTPSPAATVSASASATAYPIASATVSASASSTASASGTLSASSTSSIIPSNTHSTTSSPSVSPASSISLYSSYTLSPTQRASVYHSTTPSASQSTTLPPSPSPEAPPPPNANAVNDNPNVQLGLGLGLTTAFIAIAALLLGCFGQHLIRKAIDSFKWHVLKRRTAPRPHPPRPRVTTEAPPGTIVLTMNPTMLQQQSAMDMLQMARQQSLEAAQLAQQQLEQELNLSRAKSFKQMYKPMKASGSSV